MRQVLNAVLYGGLAVAGAVFWWRRRTTSAAWLAVTFAALGFVVLQGLVVEEAASAAQRAQFGAMQVYRDLVIIILLSTPWLLFRFVRSLRPGRGTVDHVADVGMALIVLATIVAPALPDEAGPTPPWFTLYLIAVLLWWGIVLGSVARMMWRAGRGQPGVVRRRMRLMSVATLCLGAALILSAVSRDTEPGSMVALASAALGWGGGLAFWLAVLPPAFLRRVWRVEDEVTMRETEVDLVRAETAEAAATAVVSAAAALVGGSAARIEDADGRPLASFGDITADDDTMRVEGLSSAVTISVSPYTPVFGRDEVALLRQLCTHLDLALRRIHSYEASEAARRRTEQVNTDLQQLVYGISHDLRNPLVTILGFLQILEEDVEQLSDHGRLAARRIGASAQYMDNLIQDLLQLSRVGRTDAEPAVVGLSALVAEIAADVQARHEDVTVEVATDDQILMNPVRARQLFTNLIENAARHGGRRPLTITVMSQSTADGQMVVEVADDGVGIPPAEGERVFQIFQRLGAFDADSPGSGIGLTMCRRIVEEVGGTITVAEAATGTTLRLELPTVARPSTAPRLHTTGA